MRLCQYAAYLLVALSFTACVSTRWVEYKVNTDPPGAFVDVNGTTYCDATPCTIRLQCVEKHPGSGLGTIRLSALYSVVAVPQRNGEALYSQNKVIDPCQIQEDEGGSLKFNMGLRNVLPAEQIQISH